MGIKWTEENLFSKIKEYVDDFQKFPTHQHLSELTKHGDEKFIGLDYAIRAYGGYHVCQNRIGAPTLEERIWNKDKVVQVFSFLEKRLKRIPTATQMRKIVPSAANAMTRHFGSYRNFLEEYRPTWKAKLAEEDIIDKILS